MVQWRQAGQDGLLLRGPIHQHGKAVTGMADYLIVGAGLFGAVCARELRLAGRSVRVIDRRDHIAGNVYTETRAGIDVHRYGAHIFHTSDEEVWRYVRQFAHFNHFVNSPVAVYQGRVYNLPFNMNTFSRLWGVVTPDQARAVIREQVEREKIAQPRNLEEQALSLVGRDVYETLIKGYTEKQWGRDCRDLPAFIIRRLPCRFTYDNNYFSDPYQGIPEGGYTRMVENMLRDVPVTLSCSYEDWRRAQPEKDGCVIYTGCIDEFFGYALGPLQYRTVRFETEELETDNYQGCAVVNYTEREIPWTRIIEHKHFAFGTQPTTVISREYPEEWKPGMEPYYPVNDERNAALYARYLALAEKEKGVVFGGRLGRYRYYDMDKVVREALDTVRRLLQ